MGRLGRLLRVLALALALASALRPAAPAATAVTLGGPFSLIDQDGQARSEQDLLGHYVLIAFGFTWCPDVCPTTLGEITEALTRLEARAPAKAARVLPVFVTVDPARDNVAVLKEYLGHFHPRLLGLTGELEALRGVAESYGAYFRYDDPDADGNYLVEHSPVVLLMGPQGEYLTRFDPGEGPPAILAALERQVAP